MRIVCISDTHERHRELIVPPGDMLIHAGDLTSFSKRPSMIIDFNRWLGELPHRYKIVTFGNHEFAFEADPRLRDQLSNATVLINEAAEVGGIKVWASPMTPLYGGAFGRASAGDRERIYARIPSSTQILVTHAPPASILDGNQHTGCAELLAAIRRIHPKLHVFGHVHSAYGVDRSAETTFVNAALLDGFGVLDRLPIVVDIDFGF